MNTYCILQVDGPGVEAILSAISGENGPFDFHKIVPVPDGLVSSRQTSKWFYSEALALRNAGKQELMNEIMKYEWVKGEGITSYDALAKILTERYDASIEFGETILQCKRNIGFGSREEWCSHNWGTKENAVDVEVGNIISGDLSDSVRISFFSLGAAPLPLIQKLSTMFPGYEFSMEYGLGPMDTGQVRFVSGKVMISTLPLC